MRISLSNEKDLPNRDLVIDVKVPEPKPLVYTGDRDFAALIPSTFFGEADRQRAHQLRPRGLGKQR